ncbi:hypothetical protein BpHYR1_005724 [Brachionus plicatilis]|uniref:Uncharacterized protein n=1 Tax=Brachionus plicatilis TaxID=10195 RepID=A0A3M7S244_BRAPC|nr:hypothetical protein BpHYR1_005724 [Brachionus plicatilis]
MVSTVLVPYGIKPNFDIVPRVMVTKLCFGVMSRIAVTFENQKITEDAPPPSMIFQLRLSESSVRKKGNSKETVKLLGKGPQRTTLTKYAI